MCSFAFASFKRQKYPKYNSLQTNFKTKSDLLYINEKENSQREKNKQRKKMKCNGKYKKLFNEF